MEEKKVPEYEEMHKVLNFALDAGRILLKNGAEIFRVEETIDYICKRYHIKEVDTFVLSNGIFITAEKEGKEMFAKVKHIPLSGTHLGIVTAVNDLSREITARRISLDEAIEKLKEIENMPPKKGISAFLRREWEAADFVICFRETFLKALSLLLSA